MPARGRRPRGAGLCPLPPHARATCCCTPHTPPPTPPPTPPTPPPPVCCWVATATRTGPAARASWTCGGWARRAGLACTSLRATPRARLPCRAPWRRAACWARACTCSGACSRRARRCWCTTTCGSSTWRPESGE